MITNPRTRAALRTLPVADLRAMAAGVRARVSTTAAPAAPAASHRDPVGPTAARVTPAVAARARARDVDPSTLTGTGIGGRITTEDVDQAANDALYARLFG